jgi:hypothetical protein
MRRRGLCLGLTALFLLTVCGCGKEDADRLSRIAARTGERLDQVCGGSRGKMSDSWSAARGCWTDAALDGRVATRLRWDKTLTNTSIDVKTAAPGVVRLRGKVADQATHEHVLDVAAATTGVEKIVDEVTVEGANAKE